MPAILARMLTRRADARAVVTRYHGCAAGWRPMGAPRTIADAERFASTVARILPTATLRVRPVA
jgi:hypothetical protein